jgi:hypothetical protein
VRREGQYTEVRDASAASSLPTATEPASLGSRRPAC